MPIKRIQHLFVVRLWAETVTAPTSEDWQGLVQHVPTGQKLYFTSLADLNSFIEARLGARASSHECSDEATQVAASE